MAPKKRKISKPSEMEPKAKRMEVMKDDEPSVASDFKTLLTASSDEDRQIQNAETLIKVAKNKEFDLAQEIQSLSDDEKTNLWLVCQSLLGQALLSLLEPMEGPTRNSEEVIGACTTFAKATLETLESVSEGLQKSVLMLHESLLVLPSSMDSLKSEIAKVCEIWFLKGLPEKEKLAINAFVYLLQKTVMPSGTKADIKRLNGMFEVTNEVNVMDDKLKNSLLKCVQSSNFYRAQEGQKFIANLMKLSPAFVKEVHKAFKGIISGCSKQDGCQIGEIYLKAWTVNAESENGIREQIEDCLQNFMYHCILANKKSKIFEPLLAILLPFHSSKNNKKVQKLLKNLWEPLLWRYLKVANSDVRCNATQILTDAFPLEDPEDELEARAAAQEQQIKAFQDLLKDEVPEVRATAVNGVTTILSRFWILFSATDVQEFMLVLIKSLANDMSSPKVRLSVIKGMTSLVKSCPRSHMYLKQILPKLKEVLWDSNESVRLAMLDLLFAVKNIKTIQYWNICPLEDLLERLANDKKSLSAKITTLLFNSFFPLDQNEEAKIERCVYLIQNQPEASRRFYLYLDKHVKLHDVVKFMLAILVNLKKQVVNTSVIEENDDKENEGGRGDINAGTDKNESTICKDGSIRLANDTLQQSLNDEHVVGGLVDVVCILWMSRCQELSEAKNAEYRSLLEKKSYKILTLLFKTYKNSHQVHRSVIYLCSFLPHNSALTIASFCLSKLKAADIDQTLIEKYPAWVGKDDTIYKESIFTTYVDALCNWRRGDDILEMITEWLKKGLNNEEESSKKKTKKRGVRFDQEDKARPGFGLLLLKYLLSHSLNKAILMKKNFKQLQEIKTVLEDYIPKIENCCDKEDEHEDQVDIEGNNEVAAAAWTMLLQLEILIHLNQESEANQENLVQAVQAKIQWAKDKILSKDKLNKFASHISSTLVMFSSNMITLNMSDLSLADSVLQLSSDLLEIDTDLRHIKTVLPVLVEIGQWAIFNRLSEDEIQSLKMTEMWEIASKSFQNQYENGLSKDCYGDLKKCLLQVLEYFCVKFTDDCQIMLQAMVNQCKLWIEEHFYQVEKVVLIDDKWSILNLFMEVLTSKKIAKSALACVSETFKSESPNTVIKLGTYLAMASSFKGSRSLELKEMVAEINEKRQIVNEDEYDVDIISTFDQLLATSKSSVGLVF